MWSKQTRMNEVLLTVRYGLCSLFYSRRPFICKWWHSFAYILLNLCWDYAEMNTKIDWFWKSLWQNLSCWKWICIMIDNNTSDVNGSKYIIFRYLDIYGKLLIKRLTLAFWSIWHIFPLVCLSFLPIQGGLRPVKKPLAKLIQKRGLRSPAALDWDPLFRTDVCAFSPSSSQSESD